MYLFIYLFIVTIYFRWNLLVCFPSWPWLSGLKWSSCLSLLSNQSHITTPTLLGSVLVLFFIMNPLSSIYVRGPSVLLPQETSYFLCISRTVPVETDVPHDQESLAVNVEVEQRDACPTGGVSGAAFSQQWPPFC